MKICRANLLDSNSVLSISATNLLRIIFETMVLFHHLVDVRSPFGALLSGLFGPVAVGGFILISGYGVGKSFIKKGYKYCDRIYYERIPKNYFTIIIANVFYLWLFLYTGNLFESPAGILSSFLYFPFFGEFEKLSHYIYFLADLMIYYVIFLIFINVFKKLRNPLFWTAIMTFILAIVAMVVLEIINAYSGGSGAMRGGLCFPAGLLIARFDDAICKTIKKYGALIYISLMIPVCVGLFFFDLNIFYEYIIPLFFSMGIALLFFYVKFKSKIITYLAGLIIYVYVAHEFFRELFRFISPHLTKNQNCAITLILTFATSVLIDLIIKGIKKLKKLRKKHKQLKTA